MELTLVTQTIASNPWIAVYICEASLLIWLILAHRDRAIGSSPNTGIPGPKGSPIQGNLNELLPYKEDFMGWLSKNEATYGPLFTYTVPVFGRSIVIDRPEWIEHVKKSGFLQLFKYSPC